MKKTITSIALILILAMTLSSCSLFVKPTDKTKKEDDVKDDGETVVDDNAFTEDEIDLSNYEPETLVKDIWNVPYQYDLSKYIEISEDDYIGLTYTVYSTEVTDEDIQYEIQKLLDEHAVYTDVTDRPAQEGDFVNIDYKGFIDGEELENGAEEGAEFEIGYASFIPGFQEGIVGHNVGETFTVDATFPVDYGIEELNGKVAQFEMTLNKLQTISYPEFDDAFVSANTDYKTVEEFYTETGISLERQKSSSVKVQQKNELFEKIMKSAKILAYPEAEYSRYFNTVINQYVDYAKANGQELEELITSIGATMEQLNSYADQYAKSLVDSEVIFYSIANKIEIIDSLTMADFDRYLENIAVEYLTTPEKFLDMYGAESVFASLIWDSVMDYVHANAKPSDVVDNAE